MARIRTIKPEFWEDEKVGRLPIPCRLFFIGCWNFADDYGVIKGNPALLKSQIFPYDENLRVSEVKKWLNALVEARMLIPIILDDANKRLAEESYYVIRTFRSHQVLDKRFTKSYLGKDEGFVKSLIDKALSHYAVNTPGTRREHAGDTPCPHVTKDEKTKKESAKEKNKKEENNTTPTTAPVCACEEAPEAPPLSSYRKFLASSLKSQAWLETLAMNYHMDVPRLKDLLHDFLTDNICRGFDDRGKTLRDFKSHFNNWLLVRLRVEKEQQEKQRDNGNRQGNGAAATFEQRRNGAANLVSEILARNGAQDT